MRHRFIVFAATLASALGAHAQTAPTEEDAPAPVTFRQLADAADLIALVQVADTDYQYTRGFPSGGTAFLRVLIPYKVSRPLPDLVEVYEEGLHANECYFPDPSVFEEGRRYLVFLRSSEEVERQYNGLEAGCALEALVTAGNRYALRYPLDSITLADDFRALAEPMTFSDAYAHPEDEEITPVLRNEWLAEGWLAEEAEGYRYTHGIPLAEARKRLGDDNLTRDRSLR